MHFGSAGNVMNLIVFVILVIAVTLFFLMVLYSCLLSV